ncbi:molybdopterin dehydrogenase [Zhengella mangrovi]|uniref:Molybdopterin dehydrogenase n=1 Tax=Zhengella mangrovi TaxID=1982044 RepID=A0A2G1QQF4_9HYPH|nr:FAD binding domain-containing protein [Zhengella mangrovi]PHP67797.1 molybdopterin dehydrogenase [Zhengella mangrovi]
MTSRSNIMDAVEWRAGSTDLSERRRTGISRGPITDLIPTPEMREILVVAGEGARIGSSVTLEAIGADKRLAKTYPGIAATVKLLATPQIRHVATLGGNLAQRSRCWYFRNPNISCLKKGGSDCPARAGNHYYGVAFDLGPCIAPHPSSMATALLAYDATIRTDRRDGLTLDALYGDGSNGSLDHRLEPGEVIISIDLPPAATSEFATYERAISRAQAEWPLVEIAARIIVKDARFQLVRLVAGGIAPVPLRLVGAEKAAKDALAETDIFTIAAKAAIEGAKPMPMSAYKLKLLEGLVYDVLEQCAEASAGVWIDKSIPS